MHLQSLVVRNATGVNIKKGLKTWLREVRDSWPDKWEEILGNHFGRRNWLSQIIHEVRDEW